MVRALALALLLPGCTDPPPDPDLASPLRTARTLLRAYHLDGLTEEQMKRRVRRGLLTSSDRPVDERLLQKAIADFDPSDPSDRGLTVFLVGAIAARQGRLRESIAGELGSIYAEGELLVVVERAPEGWKIRLDRSVPTMVREGVPGS